MSVIDFSNKPISILKNSSISNSIKMLLNTKISKLVVDNSKYVEIITEKDIGLFLFSETSTQGLEDISITKIMKLIKFVCKEITPRESAEIMIENSSCSLTRHIITILITVKFNEDLFVACKILLENNVNGLVVLDDDNYILGISKTDVSKVLVSV